VATVGNKKPPAIPLRGHGVIARGRGEIPLGLLCPVLLQGCDRTTNALPQCGLGLSLTRCRQNPLWATNAGRSIVRLKTPAQGVPKLRQAVLVVLRVCSWACLPLRLGWPPPEGGLQA
jgi:hypothetical protein